MQQTGKKTNDFEFRMKKNGEDVALDFKGNPILFTECLVHCMMKDEKFAAMILTAGEEYNIFKGKGKK